MSTQSTTLRTTCPRDCYDTCGIVVVPREGRTPIVRGDPEHPVSRGKLCAKCSTAYNGVFLDPGARVTTPLRRSGAKGTGSFRPVGWDEAMAEVASHLRPLAADGPATTVITAHYTGTFAMIGYHFPLRFLHRLGATEVDPDTICNKAGQVALDYLYGTSSDGFDPRSLPHAASVLVWGANPSASGPHQDEHWLGDAACPVIVVDPLRTPTAAHADLHLQPRPGTDAALAFGMIHVLARDGLADRDWLARYAVGSDELLAVAGGCDPAWTEAATGVRAELVEEAARTFGAGPSLLWIGQGLQRQPRGGNVVRAVASLPAVTGAIGRLGGGFLYLNGQETRGIDGDYLAGTHLARDGAEAPISHLDLLDRLEDPERARALICWNINIVGSNPQQARLRRALQREDLFTVVVDPFPTDTADYADVVLPAATFLEQDDIVASYFHHSVSPQVRLLDPPGEAMPNSEIFRRLAAAMGYEEPELYELDDDIIARMLADTGLVMDFAELARSGTVWPSPEVRLQFPDLHFPTPSGHVELASERAAADGLPRLPEPWADPAPPAGTLRLLSPSSEWSLNTLYGNDPGNQRRAGTLTVTLHADDAAKRGLAAGDQAVVSNAEGQLEVGVVVDDAVPPGVALIPKGRWPKTEAGGANVNVLNPGDRSDMGDSSAVHGTLVTVEVYSDVRLRGSIGAAAQEHGAGGVPEDAQVP